MMAGSGGGWRLAEEVPLEDVASLVLKGFGQQKQ
jgi:hypothetical protein